jgi:hypothetical protein
MVEGFVAHAVTSVVATAPFSPSTKAPLLHLSRKPAMLTSLCRT